MKSVDSMTLLSCTALIGVTNCAYLLGLAIAKITLLHLLSWVFLYSKHQKN